MPKAGRPDRAVHVWKLQEEPKAVRCLHRKMHWTTRRYWRVRCFRLRLRAGVVENLWVVAAPVRATVSWMLRTRQIRTQILLHLAALFLADRAPVRRRR